MAQKAPKTRELLKFLESVVAGDVEVREKFTKDIKNVVAFEVDGVIFTLDLRIGKGELVEGKIDAPPAVTLIMNDQTFINIAQGKTSPQSAFLMRRLKIKGPMNLALKLLPVLELAKPAAKM